MTDTTKPDLGTTDVHAVAPMPGDKGVRYNPPPDELIPSIKGSIRKALEATGGADLALVAVADRKGGWNSALVAGVGDPDGKKGRVEVLTWIGKEWGSDADLDYGAKVLWTKKF